MKKIISFIFVVVLVVGLVLLGIWFLKQKRGVVDHNPQDTPSQTLPVVTNNPSQGIPMPEQPSNPVIQNNKDPNKKVVASNFLRSIKNPDNIKLFRSAIESDYALQEWGDDNKGGQALLKYTDANGWVLVSMGGGGQDIQVPLSHAMRELQSDAQLVNTKFQEDLYEKINDPSKDLRGVHDEHILPALRAANKDGVDLATAKAIRKWSAGELEWPLVTLGVKNNVREPAKGETPEAYAQYLASLANEGKKSAESLIGYGPSSVKRISASALRNDELAGKIHPMLSHQIAHRLDYLRNSDDYNAAVKNSEKAHFQNMKKKGQYGQYADVPPGSNKFVNGNIGVLSLDGLHPLHSYISGGYQVGRHGNAKDKRGLRQVAPEPQQVPNVPVQVPVDDAEKQAAVIDKLVRYALKLDAKGRFAEADLVDSLIHKLEVMV
jgi:hypothetical protein